MKHTKPITCMMRNSCIGLTPSIKGDNSFARSFHHLNLRKSSNNRIQTKNSMLSFPSLLNSNNQNVMKCIASNQKRDFSWRSLFGGVSVSAESMVETTATEKPKIEDDYDFNGLQIIHEQS